MAEVGARNLVHEMETASTIESEGLGRSKLVEDKLAEARHLWQHIQNDHDIPEMAETRKRLEEMLKNMKDW